MKQRKCKNPACKKLFTPGNSIQPVCFAVPCVMWNHKQAKKKKLKAEKKNARIEYRSEKEKLKTLSEHLNDAQKIFNTFIRKRDEGLNCVSCGKQPKKKNAGHYRSVGSCPELRFEELNVHLQCERCNQYQGGNLIWYRKYLKIRIGIKKIEWLEGPHEPKRYRIDDAKRIKEEYKKKLKELED